MNTLRQKSLLKIEGIVGVVQQDLFTYCIRALVDFYRKFKNNYLCVFLLILKSF